MGRPVRRFVRRRFRSFRIGWRRVSPVSSSQLCRWLRSVDRANNPRAISPRTISTCALPMAAPTKKTSSLRPTPGRPLSPMWSVARGCEPKLSWPGQSVGKPMNHRSEDGDDEGDQRRSAALIGLIIILALAIAGVWLVRELREKSQLEDCLMSGRTNCAPIEAPSRR